MFSSSVALITSAISPHPNHGTLDAGLRLQQTLDALYELHKQKIFQKAIFIDGTGVDIKPHLAAQNIDRNWIDCHLFHQEPELVQRYGYGYGELLIYEEFIRLYPNNNLSVYKLTGRYRVSNITNIVQHTANFADYFFTFYPRHLEYRKYVQTALMKVRVSDLPALTISSKRFLEVNVGAPLEMAVYDWVIHSGRDRHWTRVPLPRFVGVGGFTGKSLDKTYFPFNFFSRMETLFNLGFQTTDRC